MLVRRHSRRIHHHHHHHQFVRNYQYVVVGDLGFTNRVPSVKSVESNGRMLVISLHGLCQNQTYFV